MSAFPRSPEPGWRNPAMSEARSLGVAIVGCGMIARFHARALQEVAGAKLVALVSRSRANAEDLMKTVGVAASVHTDLAPVLERKDVDLVIVTTPSGAHLEP